MCEWIQSGAVVVGLSDDCVPEFGQTIRITSALQQEIYHCKRSKISVSRSEKTETKT